MSKPKLRRGGRKPKSYRLAHNHVSHTDVTRNGEHGFRRFWVPPQDWQWLGRVSLWLERQEALRQEGSRPALARAHQEAGRSRGRLSGG
jgi:hypothetical protein